MRKISSASFVSPEIGEFYWTRITSFIPGATFSIDGRGFFPVDSLGAWEIDKSGTHWKRMEWTGTVNFEIGDDPTEKFPGPVNPPGPLISSPSLLIPSYNGPIQFAFTGNQSFTMFISGAQFAQMRLSLPNPSETATANINVQYSADGALFYKNAFGIDVGTTGSVFAFDGTAALGAGGLGPFLIGIPGDCVAVKVIASGFAGGAVLTVRLEGFIPYITGVPVTALLFDKLSGVASALDTGSIFNALRVSGWNWVHFWFSANGGVPAYSIAEIDDTGTQSAALITNAAEFAGSIGPGGTINGTAGIVPATSQLVLPRYLRFQSAAIAAQTSRIYVVARR